MEQMQKDITELKIAQAVTQEKIHNLDEKLDDIGSDIKEIRKSCVEDVKKSNTFLRNWIVKLTMVILGGGGAGAVVTAMMKVM